MDIYVHARQSIRQEFSGEGTPSGPIRLLSANAIRLLYPGVRVTCRRSDTEVVQMKMDDDGRPLFWPAAQKNHARRLKREADEEEDDDGDE